MYHAIIRRRVESLFRRANSGDWEAIVDSLAPSFSYRFIGETPLGGTRTTHAAMRLWWQRLYRLFPGAVFEPETIVAQGPPWRTTVMTHVRIRGTVPTHIPPGGTAGTRPYENEFMQCMSIRWGKVTSVTTLEDTQRFVGILPVLVASGITDAAAAPIVDDLAIAGR